MESFAEWLNVREMAYRPLNQEAEVQRVLDLGKQGYNIARIHDITGLARNTIQRILNKAGNRPIVSRRRRVNQDIYDKVLKAANANLYMNNREIARLFGITRETVIRWLKDLPPEVKQARAVRQKNLEGGRESPYSQLPMKLAHQPDERQLDRSAYYNPFGRWHKDSSLIKSLDKQNLIPPDQLSKVVALYRQKLHDYIEKNSFTPNDATLRAMAQDAVAQFTGAKPMRAAAHSIQGVGVRRNVPRIPNRYS